MSVPPFPPLESVLGRTRREALDAFAGQGWRTWARPPDLDAERRRLLNVDLTEPEVSWEQEGEVRAVAHVETDLAGTVTHVEVVGTEPADPLLLALALLGEAGPPRTGGGADAREWIWGPESGSRARAGGEPVRLWVCTERAYGDRLWAIATLAQRE